MKTDVWEITGTGSRTFTAIGETLLEVLTSLIVATDEAGNLLTDDNLAGGVVIAINFVRDEFEGTLTVEV
jgi:hypothetical protein